MLVEEMKVGRGRDECSVKSGIARGDGGRDWLLQPLLEDINKERVVSTEAVTLLQNVPTLGGMIYNGKT